MKITEILNSVTENENSAFFFTPPYYKGEKCYYFTNPAKIVTINTREEYDIAFCEVERIRENHIILVLMNYETGYLFEEKFSGLLPGKTGEDLITLICYDKNNSRVFDNREILTPDEEDICKMGDYEISNFSFNTTFEEYNSALAEIKKHIYDGDTYQVNYTVKSKFDFKGNYARLFLNLITNQSTKYSAFINLQNKFIVSASPELFFEMNDDMVITRPMKGTIQRGINRFDDARLKKILLNSEKDKAENVMIVDLLRNDFGRIAEFGSVKVESLYDIEKYESVFQMTSTISAKLKNKQLGNIIESVFPCGSITGAPKIRTMEIINQLEKEPRGIYTGSIGIIEKNSAKFNVAIRTLVIDKMSSKGEIGLGGGIVWDSIPDKEYNEVLVKGLFLTKQDKPFQLIETLLFENGCYFLLSEHLYRLKHSADYFLFSFDEEAIINELALLTKRLSEDRKYKIRLLLNKDGKVSIFTDQLENNPSDVKVVISEKRVDAQSKFQYFKTTNRSLYDNEYKTAISKGYFDVLFFNENEELIEGAITNLFILKEGVWHTPEVVSGLLSGCYRDLFKRNNRVIEKKLKYEDLLLADQVLLTNSVRKEIFVREIWSKGKIVWKLNH